MKKIFILLSLILCACDNSDDNKKNWDNMVDALANQEYQDCIGYAAQEFPNIPTTDNEKTCRCVIDYLYLADAESGDRFAIDLRAILKDKCGENIPSYTLRDIPTE